MTSSTHMIAATISVTAINIMGGNPLHPMPIAVAAFTSMLPDVDHPDSKLGKLCQPISRFLYRKVGHRTLTHSVFGCLLAAICFWPLKWIDIGMPLYRAALIGYISHAVIDLANLEGVALTYPIAPHHRWVFPADIEYRIKSKTEKEQLLRILSGVFMTGLIALNLAGGKSLMHNFLGTSDAMARSHYQQLVNGHRIVIRVKGIWTRGQGRVDEAFDVVASTDAGIFVRRPGHPLEIYEVNGGEFSAISHAKLEIARRIKAEQRIVKIKFNWERWREDLTDQYPNALVSGSLVTRAKPPSYKVDEFPTIQQFADRWELTHAPIELVSQRLRESGAKMTGEIQIRYWKERSWNEEDNDHT